MNRKFTSIILLASAFTAFATDRAEAHNGGITAACVNGRAIANANLTNYNGTNTISIKNDGTERSPGTFGSSYVDSFDLGDPSIPHVVTFKVVAHDDPTNAKGWSPSGTIDVPACAPPVPTTTTTQGPLLTGWAAQADCVGVTWWAATVGKLDVVVSVIAPNGASHHEATAVNGYVKDTMEFPGDEDAYEWSVDFGGKDVKSGSVSKCATTTTTTVAATTTTVAPTAVPATPATTLPDTTSTAPAPTVAPSSSVLAVAPTAPTAPPAPAGLPRTGPDEDQRSDILQIALVALGLGCVVVAGTRRRSSPS